MQSQHLRLYSVSYRVCISVLLFYCGVLQWCLWCPTVSYSVCCCLTVFVQCLRCPWCLWCPTVSYGICCCPSFCTVSVVPMVSYNVLWCLLCLTVFYGDRGVRGVLQCLMVSDVVSPFFTVSEVSVVPMVSYSVL